VKPVRKSSSQSLVVCVENDGYVTSLETRKIYLSIPDASAEKHGLLRVIDESGEDYLYPKRYYVYMLASRSRTNSPFSESLNQRMTATRSCW
jgi:hypothetical protein